MDRALGRLADESFDVLVVGGGAFGAAVARDAAQRGLRTALVEKDDFCSGASGNSFRMVHGGIRYLQHLDVRRVRHSAQERAVFLTTAPHLVRPLPIVMPTRGWGLQGRAVLRAGFLLYDALTLDRNRRAVDPDRRIPACRMLAREEVLELFPGLPGAGLTGAGLFHDAQMLHPARLVLAMLRSAEADGAALVNHAEVTGLLRDGSRVTGARVTDREGGGTVDVRARVVVVAAGAWTDALLRRGARTGAPAAAPFSRDVCLVTDLPAEHGYALAVPGTARDPDALISRSGRHLFVVPWLGRLIVGVWHRVYARGPERIHVGEDEIDAYVREVDDGFPGLGLSRANVVAHNTGLVLVEATGEQGTTPRFGKRSRLVDHGPRGTEGLISLVGVRYTTARYDAARTVDLAAGRLSADPGPCRTRRTPVFGADFESVAGLRRDVARGWPELEGDAVDSLVRGYGSAHADVRALATSPELARPLPGSHVLGAEVVHAVRREMAIHLDDVVLRRTELGCHGPPDEAALEAASRLMAEEQGWSEARRSEEIGRVRSAAAGPADLLPSAGPDLPREPARSGGATS